MPGNSPFAAQICKIMKNKNEENVRKCLEDPKRLEQNENGAKLGSIVKVISVKIVSATDHYVHTLLAAAIR